MGERELKFRIWDVFKNEMIYDPTEFELRCIETNRASKDTTNSYIGFYNVDTDRFKIMQCTGLLDKNDLEIYEGDVIKWLGLLWIVDYNIRGARFIIDCTTLNTFDTLEWCKDFEKVGNRHENPELLEATNELHI